jgi:hypothetical protein
VNPAFEAARRSAAVARLLTAIRDRRIQADDRLLEAIARLASSAARWSARALERGEGS